MKIYQLYYTSCKKGLTSGMGFQTYSMSEGITEEERQEIEKHCNYIEPSSLTSNPTEKEIEELFPIAFSFFKLKNGKSCICKIKYKGKDYSGRFGNYFCHVLMLDNGELPFYPIEIYNSGIFKAGLTEEEENAEDISPLPILNYISEGDFITTSDIEKFLKGASAKKRTKSLNDLIDGIIDAKESDKKIVFSDDAKNLHMWIAAATMALPLSMANSITFSTYSFDAFNVGEFLCGGLEENLGAQLNTSNKNYKFNTFNFKSGISSEVGLKTKFAKQAALEYTIIKDYRKDIIEFIEHFNYKKIDSNIDNCINLFSIINNGLEKVNDEDAVNAIAFANKYGSEDTLEKIMSTIDAEALNKITTNLNLKMAEAMFKFLFRISKLTGKTDYINKAYEFFFDSIQFMVVDGNDINIEDIIKLYQDIRNYNEDNLQNFVSKSSYGERLRNIAVYLEGGIPRHAQFYFCSIIGDFIVLEKVNKEPVPWNYFGQNIDFKKFVVVCLKLLLQDKNKFSYVLRYVQDYADYFSNVVNIAYEVCTSGENYITLISSYTDILYEISFYKSSEIIKKLLEKKHGADVLILSFKYKIRSTTDKVNYFNSYCTNIFDANIDYRNRYFSAALEVLISGLQKYEFNMSFYENITKYIKARKLEKSLGKKLSEKLVGEFQNLLSIKLPDETELSVIAEINDIKYLYKIEASPNISEIIQCADLLCNEKIYIEEFLCSDDIFKFDGISKEKYKDILDLMFKIMCPKLNDILSHMKMKKIFMYDKYMITYFNNYMSAMEDIFDSKGTNKIYLDFICFIIKNESLFSQKQFKDIEKNIIRNICRVDIANLENYDKYIQKTIENSTINDETRKSIRLWMGIYKTAKKDVEGKSIFDKIQQKIYRK